MKLTIVTTRVVENSKVEVCAGSILGIDFEVVKIYSRSSIHHNFKLKDELFKTAAPSKQFSSFVLMRKFITSTTSKK